MSNGRHTYASTEKYWTPEPLDIDDPLRGHPDDEDVIAILRTLHRDAADAWDARFLTAEDQRALMYERRKDGL